MKRYISASALEDDIEHVITDIVLEDVNGTFSLEAYDDFGDTIWVARNEDIKNNIEYCMCTAEQGFLYGNESLYEVLVRFAHKYYVNFDFVKQIFKFARNYTHNEVNI